MTEEPQKPDSEAQAPKAQASRATRTWHDDTPFPKHWIGYVAIKVLILVVAVVAGLWWYGLL